EAILLGHECVHQNQLWTQLLEPLDRFDSIRCMVNVVRLTREHHDEECMESLVIGGNEYPSVRFNRRILHLHRDQLEDGAGWQRSRKNGQLGVLVASRRASGGRTPRQRATFGQSRT